MRTGLRIHFLLLSCLLLFATVAAAVPSQELRLGYVTDLTGRGAFFGTQSTRGAKLAQSESSALEIIVEDTGGDSSRALSAVSKLIDLDRVDAIVCDLTPICTPIVSKVAAAKKPLVYLSPATSIAKRYPYAYRNFIDYVEGCRALAKVWRARDLRDVATLTPNMEFGELCVEGFEEIYRGHRAVRYNPGDDLRTPLLAMRSAGISAVLQVGYEPDFLNWFKLCKEQHYRPLQGFMEVMLSKSVRDAIGDGALRADIFGYEELSSDFASQLDRVAPLAGGDFNRQGAALAYNGIKMLERAYKDCSDRSDQVCIDRSLRSPPIAGLLMGFRGWKDENAPYPIRVKGETL